MCGLVGVWMNHSTNIISHYLNHIMFYVHTVLHKSYTKLNVSCVTVLLRFAFFVSSHQLEFSSSVVGTLDAAVSPQGVDGG